jgi:hypothetical protein
MNEANVMALAGLLAEYRDEPGDDPARYREAAEWLASRGVLVPSALTDEEVFRVTDLGPVDRMSPDEYTPTGARIVRYELERIAKGD